MSEEDQARPPQRDAARRVGEGSELDEFDFRFLPSIDQRQVLEREEGMGAARAGHGLLARLLRCGRCGRKLHVRCWGRHGTAARYLCVGTFRPAAGNCVRFGGATVDCRIGEEVVRVLSPLGFAPA